MSPSLFILTISLYLLSVVSGLVAAFFVRQIPLKFIKSLIGVHFLLLIFWLVTRNEMDSISEPGKSNYLFLGFFCTGIFNAGMLLRLKFPFILKMYYLVYLLSLVVFVISPSRVLGFIASGNYSASTGSRFHISDNYYFVEQQAISGSLTNVTGMKSYKLVREMRMFYKTLSRDVLLPANTDSISLLDTNFTELVQVRAYFPVQDKRDSIDLKIEVGNHRDDSNEIKQIRK